MRMKYRWLVCSLALHSIMIACFSDFIKNIFPNKPHSSEPNPTTLIWIHPALPQTPGIKHKKQAFVPLKKLFPNQSDISASNSSSGHSQIHISGKDDSATFKNPHVSVEIFGKPEQLPLLQEMANQLHNSLSFSADLHSLNQTGLVKLQLQLNEAALIDESSFKGQSQAKYLLTYTLKTTHQTFSKYNPPLLKFLKQTPDSRAIVHIRFRAGPTQEFTTNPTPQLLKQRIQMDRHYHTKGIKFFGGTLHGENTAVKWSLGFDVESLLSRDHRKRYGWSGQKIIESQARAKQIEYDELYTSYMHRGWIENGS